MSFVVSLEGFTPGQRYDDQPWTQARIEQATARSGPFTAIETVTFADPDADPMAPKTRDFTTDLATIAQGWFRVVFLDPTGAEQDSAAVYFPGGGSRPTVEEVGALIRARTKTSLSGGGTEVGTFNANTRPTGDEVTSMIERIDSSLAVRLGANLPEVVWPAVRETIALKAAMWVERARQPEQISDTQSAYSELKEEYEEAWTALRESVREAGSGEDPGAIDDAYLPSSSFPGGEPVGWATQF